MNNTGLTDKEVLINREKYGTNKIDGKIQDSFCKLLIESLGDPIIKILLIALGIKIVFLLSSFDWYETIGIVIAILLASFISTISEYGSEKAFKRLQEENSTLNAKIKRSNNLVTINSNEIVVNDIIKIESGDKICADGYIISGEVFVDESTINGEAKEKLKKAVISKNRINENNKVYRGTTVYSKSAYMLVTSVGNNTLYGKLSKELTDKQPESPLKLRLRKLALTISKIGYIGSVLVSISFLFNKIIIENNFNINLIIDTITNLPLMFSYLLYALTLSVTIIVVAVPEGLPMMITLVLSSNMKRMLKNNVLVRKMTGIETAGSINILFTDKTGTLTNGKLEVINFMSGNKINYYNELELEKYPKLHFITKISMIINNDCQLNSDGKLIGGNITDRALINFMGDKGNLRIKILDKIDFDSKNKYSITKINLDSNINLIKGAPEIILNKCKSYYTEDGSKSYNIDHKSLNLEIKKMTEKGIRVIALAASSSKVIDDLSNLTLVGLVFIKDEVRDTAKDAIKIVKEAGIQPVMITGDNILTATSIGRELDLIKSNEDIILTSEDLSNLSDDQIKEILPKLKIVARSLPSDKSRLVKLSREVGLVVGMTGDGVNDAPALKHADVGFSMGSGSEVAKEASDIVILDNNFLSITKAILYGRTIFKSIRKFIIVQLTINLCAITLSFLGPFIGIDTPVTVIQMLWINMVMDTLAGLAFAFEAPLKEYMKEKPKSKDESIINKYMVNQILATGIYSSILCVLFLKVPFISNMFRTDTNNIYLMTAFFGLFIFIDIFNCFNARTHRLNIFSNILKNKMFIIIMSFILVVQILLIYFGGSMFRTAYLLPKEFLIMIMFAITVIPYDFIRKYILKLQNKKLGV